MANLDKNTIRALNKANEKQPRDWHKIFVKILGYAIAILFLAAIVLIYAAGLIYITKKLAF